MKEIQWWNSLTHTHTHRQTVVYSLASYHICMTIRIDSLYIPFLSVMVLFCCLSILLDVKSWPASVHVPTHKETTQCLPPLRCARTTTLPGGISVPHSCLPHSWPSFYLLLFFFFSFFREIFHRDISAAVIPLPSLLRNLAAVCRNLLWWTLALQLLHKQGHFVVRFAEGSSRSNYRRQADSNRAGTWPG
jgi:hypothetical protein